MADIFLVTSLVLGCSVRRWWCDHVQSDNNRSSLLTHSALRCVVGLYLSLIALIQHRAPLIMKCVWYVRRVWKPQIWYYSTEHWAAQLIKGAWLVSLHLQWCVQKIGHVCSAHCGWVTVHFSEHYTLSDVSKSYTRLERHRFWKQCYCIKGWWQWYVFGNQARVHTRRWRCSTFQRKVQANQSITSGQPCLIVENIIFLLFFVFFYLIWFISQGHYDKMMSGRFY